MILFLYVFISIFLLAWVLYPLRGSLQSSSTKDPLLQERITSVEASLKQLYEEGKSKISPEDFQNIERQLLISLAKLYQRAGMEPQLAGSSQAQQPTIPPAPTKETATSAPTATHAFCSQCGTALKEKFSFCPGCGAAVQVAS